MKNVVMVTMVLFFIFGNHLIQAVASTTNYQITINTNKSEYLHGESVNIIGEVKQNGISKSNIDVSLKLEFNGSVLQVDQTRTTSSGYTFLIGLGKDIPIGEYKVVVQALGVSNQINFKVVKQPSSGGNVGPAPIQAPPTTPNPPMYPTLPDSVKKLNGIPTSTSVTLTWEALNNSPSYILKRDMKIIYQGSELTYIDKGLQSNKEYEYEIVSVNAKGTSSPAKLSVKTLKEIPKSPSDFTYTAAAASLSFTWSVDSEVDKYEVKRNGTVVYSGSKNNFIDSSLAPGTKYNYELFAVNSSGTSKPITLSANTLGKNSNPVLILKGTSTENQVTLNWSKENNAEKYVVKLQNKVVYSGTSNTYTQKNLKANSSYTFHVIASNKSGQNKETKLTMKTKPKTTTTTITAPKKVFKRNESINLKIKVLDINKKPVPSVNVTTVITDSQGKATTYNGKTTKSGVVELVIKTSKTSHLGTYKVKTSTKINSNSEFSNSTSTLSYQVK